MSVAATPLFAFRGRPGDDRGMVKMLLRWLMPIAALVLLGPIVGRTIAALRASDGGTDVSFLTGADPIAGLLE